MSILHYFRENLESVPPSKVLGIDPDTLDFGIGVSLGVEDSRVFSNP